MRSGTSAIPNKADVVVESKDVKGEPLVTSENTSDHFAGSDVPIMFNET